MSWALAVADTERRRDWGGRREARGCDQGKARQERTPHFDRHLDTDSDFDVVPT